MKINSNRLRTKLKKIPVKHLTLLLSICGVCMLYGLSLFQQPILLTSIQSIEDYEGKEVTLTGSIIDYTSTKYGSQLITVQCNTTKLTIFSEQSLSIHKGDIIQATGTIQKYKDSWELILSNPKTAKIMTTWKNRTVKISDLANHPNDYLDIPCNITGYIDLTYENLIYITDYSNTYSIPLIHYDNTIPKTGTNVHIHATLTYDPNHLRYILTDCEQLDKITPNQENSV